MKVKDRYSPAQRDRVGYKYQFALELKNRYLLEGRQSPFRFDRSPRHVFIWESEVREERKICYKDRYSYLSIGKG